MNLLKKAATVLVILLSLNSCAKETECKTGGLNIALTELKPGEDDTIILRTFVKGSNFSDQLKETQLLYPDAMDAQNQIFGDTLLLNGYEVKFHDSDKNNTGFLSAEYDYEIITKNHSYFFSKLSTLAKTRKCGGLLSLECPDCFSPVVAFVLNQQNKITGENKLVYLPN